MSVLVLNCALLSFCECYLIFFVVALFTCQVTVIPSSTLSMVGFSYCNIWDSKFFNDPCFGVVVVTQFPAECVPDPYLYWFLI